MLDEMLDEMLDAAEFLITASGNVFRGKIFPTFHESSLWMPNCSLLAVTSCILIVP